jgi:hypothetical protein
MASASVSHDVMYWSVPLPLKLVMAWTFSRRLSAVIRFSTAFPAISGGCRAASGLCCKKKFEICGVGEELGCWSSWLICCSS